MISQYSNGGFADVECCRLSAVNTDPFESFRAPPRRLAFRLAVKVADADGAEMQQYRQRHHNSEEARIVSARGGNAACGRKKVSSIVRVPVPVVI